MSKFEAFNIGFTIVTFWNLFSLCFRYMKEDKRGSTGYPLQFQKDGPVYNLLWLLLTGIFFCSSYLLGVDKFVCVIRSLCIELLKLTLRFLVMHKILMKSGKIFLLLFNSCGMVVRRWECSWLIARQRLEGQMWL